MPEIKFYSFLSVARRTVVANGRPAAAGRALLGLDFVFVFSFFFFSVACFGSHTPPCWLQACYALYNHLFK